MFQFYPHPATNYNSTISPHSYHRYLCKETNHPSVSMLHEIETGPLDLSMPFVKSSSPSLSLPSSSSSSTSSSPSSYTIDPHTGQCLPLANHHNGQPTDWNCLTLDLSKSTSSSSSSSSYSPIASVSPSSTNHRHHHLRYNRNHHHQQSTISPVALTAPQKIININIVKSKDVNNNNQLNRYNKILNIKDYDDDTDEMAVDETIDYNEQLTHESGDSNHSIQSTSSIPMTITNVPNNSNPIISTNKLIKDEINYNIQRRNSISNFNSSTVINTNLTNSNNLIRKPRERAMLPCEYCGKSFDRPSLLRRHLRTHTGEKPHVCDVCGKGFSTSSSLNTHRRIHSGEKPHQCPICGKRFTASSNLYYHRMTHSKDKPHKCSMCGKSFPTPGDLKAHAYIHNGHWPFKCSICNRGFSKQTNLKNHLFLHTGDKPHVCKICDKRFALACNLRAHLKTHQNGNNNTHNETTNINNTTTTTIPNNANNKSQSSSFSSSSLSSSSSTSSSPLSSSLSTASSSVMSSLSSSSPPSTSLTSTTSTSSSSSSSTTLAATTTTTTSTSPLIGCDNNSNLNLNLNNNLLSGVGINNITDDKTAFSSDANLQQFFLMAASILAIKYRQQQDNPSQST